MIPLGTAGLSPLKPSLNLPPSSVSSSRYRPALTPHRTFFIYNLNVNFFGNNNFFDFPQLGMDQDAVLFTANIFNGNNFLGADFFAVAKARLYNGLGFSVPVFTGLVVLWHRQSFATKTPRHF